MVADIIAPLGVEGIAIIVVMIAIAIASYLDARLYANG